MSSISKPQSLTARVETKERNLNLRDKYSQFISEFRSHYIVYVDESDCDKRIGFRRTGWSTPLGMTLVIVVPKKTKIVPAAKHQPCNHALCNHISSYNRIITNSSTLPLSRRHIAIIIPSLLSGKKKVR
ncbi:hypothetical protein N7460_001494 [Penicillium canescens]|uniref:Transposase n=1 Tax=Penicillium canescens TaxID=5083 RepID=A0AAD6IJC2_PENCN|nr:hypothetical protein N7460_001494 [Penicillium canescens]